MIRLQRQLIPDAVPARLSLVLQISRLKKLGAIIKRLQLYRCGRCISSCPANQTGKKKIIT